MSKIVLKYGIITGALITIFMVFYYTVFYSIETENKLYCTFGFLGILVSFIVPFFGILKYRDNTTNQLISFQKAFLIGVLISSIGSLIYLGYSTYDYHFNSPNLLDKDIKYQLRPAVTNMLDKNTFSATYERISNLRIKYKNPFTFILYTIGDILPFGIFISFVSALILKRKEEIS